MVRFGERDIRVFVHGSAVMSAVMTTSLVLMLASGLSCNLILSLETFLMMIAAFFGVAAMAVGVLLEEMRSP